MNWHAIPAVALFGLASLSHAAPQTFNTALPVAKGEFVLREQLFTRHAKDGRSTVQRNLQTRGIISVLGMGVARNWAVFGMVPYLDKSLKSTTAVAELSRKTTGIGDARLFARYTFHQNNAIGRTFRVAAFFGVEAPTGDDDERDSLGPLPAPLQSGSGSWDLFGGIVVTYQTLDFQIDTQLSHKINSQAGGFEFGDETRLDASLQYRFWPRELDESGVPGYLYGVVESSFRYYGKNTLNGSHDPNSGGTAAYLSPGIQYVTRRWVVEAIVEVPLEQDPGGNAIKDDYTVRLGFRVNF